MHQQLEATTADGVTLRIDRVPAMDARRGAVVCLHAMMTDGRYFGARRENSFAMALAEAGIEVFVADFRGHGRSIPPVAGVEDWSFDDLVDFDLPAIIRATDCDPGELSILGHSLGGLVACAALATGRIPKPRSLVLAATNVWLGESPARRALMAAYRGVTAMFGKAPVKVLRAGNADESVTYIEQLTGWAKNARWTSMSGVDYMVALETIDTPAYAFAGAGDWMCKPADADAIAKRIQKCSHVRVVGIEQGDPLDPDHFQLFTRPELTLLRREIVDAVVG
jgi:alpha-beta hydrolase superfamily lysophospholipase